jgi:hypothetical protein
VRAAVASWKLAYVIDDDSPRRISRERKGVQKDLREAEGAELAYSETAIEKLQTLEEQLAISEARLEVSSVSSSRLTMWLMVSMFSAAGWFLIALVSLTAFAVTALS